MSKTPNFDSIKRFDENSLEYWSARDLYLLLGYTKWERFDVAIQKAIAACSSLTPPIPVDEHFPTSWKAITGGHGAKQQVKDYQLSRLACYLIAQNGDTRKPEIAAAQFYFAVQTRRQELADELASLPENKKRIRYRRDIKRLNSELQDTARDAGVISRQEFADFQDQGYIGLYNGLRENDIHERKALKPKDKILDYMGSEELVLIFLELHRLMLRLDVRAFEEKKMRIRHILIWEDVSVNLLQKEVAQCLRIFQLLRRAYASCRKRMKRKRRDASIFSNSRNFHPSRMILRGSYNL